MTTRHLYRAEMLVTSARDSLSYVLRKLEDKSIPTKTLENHLRFTDQHLAEVKEKLLPMRDRNWQEEIERDRDDDLIPY